MPETTAIAIKRIRFLSPEYYRNIDADEFPVSTFDTNLHTISVVSSHRYGESVLSVTRFTRQDSLSTVISE